MREAQSRRLASNRPLATQNLEAGEEIQFAVRSAGAAESLPTSPPLTVGAPDAGAGVESISGPRVCLSGTCDGRDPRRGAGGLGGGWGGGGAFSRRHQLREYREKKNEEDKQTGEALSGFRSSCLQQLAGR